MLNTSQYKNHTQAIILAFKWQNTKDNILYNYVFPRGLSVAQEMDVKVE